MRKVYLLFVVLIGIFITSGCGEKGLTFTEAGTFNYEDKKEVNQDVHIKATGVILQDMIINGDLYIDDEVGDGHIELHNLEVNGTLHVFGGGLETIVIQDGMILKLIGYVDGRVLATDGAVIDEIIIKEPGMVLENDETALESFPNVVVDITDPKDEDQPVIFDGNFDEVEIKPGSNVELIEQARIKYMHMPLISCSISDCPENYARNRVKVNGQATLEKIDINGPTDIENNGTTIEKKYGEDILPDGNKKTSEADENYTPQMTKDVSVSISESGDYSLSFETNNEGTVYYIVQPWFDSTGITITAEDVVNKNGYNFTVEPGDEMMAGMKVVSAKSIEVSSAGNAVNGNGYMGDHMGSRPPSDDNIKYDSVIWYVFKDKLGNYSDVGKLVIK